MAWRIVDTQKNVVERRGLSMALAQKLAAIFNKSEKRGKPLSRYKAEEEK